MPTGEMRMFRKLLHNTVENPSNTTMNELLYFVSKTKNNNIITEATEQIEKLKSQIGGNSADGNHNLYVVPDNIYEIIKNGIHLISNNISNTKFSLIQLTGGNDMIENFDKKIVYGPYNPVEYVEIKPKSSSDSYRFISSVYDIDRIMNRMSKYNKIETKPFELTFNNDMGYAIYSNDNLSLTFSHNS